MQILLLTLAALLVGPGTYAARPSVVAAPRRATAVPTSVELTGILLSIDREREVLRLDTGSGLRTVELFDETEYLLPSGRRTELSDLREDEEVRVTGEERNGRLLARRIVVLGPGQPLDEPERTDARGRTVVVGTVRTPTYLVSRKIKIRTSRGDVTVDAGHDTAVTQYGGRVSVHELERGDRVQVTGLWTGDNRIRAARIDTLTPETGVEATRGYRSSNPAVPMRMVTVIGFLVSHDEDRDRMRLSTRDGDRIIVANGTPAYMGSEQISRREIRQGDRVRAMGYWKGREIMATRVELAY